MGLVIWITTFVKLLSDIFCYVDDTYGWDFKDSLMYYPPYKKKMLTKQAQLLFLWDFLGIPHKEKKQLHSTLLPIIGFEIDPNAMTAKLLPDSKANLEKWVQEFINTPSRCCTLHEFQCLTELHTPSRAAGGRIIMINSRVKSRQPQRQAWTLEQLVHKRAVALGAAIDASTANTYSSALNRGILPPPIHVALQYSPTVHLPSLVLVSSRFQRVPDRLQNPPLIPVVDLVALIYRRIYPALNTTPILLCMMGMVTTMVMAMVEVVVMVVVAEAVMLVHRPAHPEVAPVVPVVLVAPVVPMVLVAQEVQPEAPLAVHLEVVPEVLVYLVHLIALRRLTPAML
ncbi:hypothetical protein DFH07DRAFT_949913 [Mycena maculata]|uniref:Uncharacterized protein n=1 Tax=Mycena maculata TaxID=230809 RepID=A0AAD7NY28_9AGAR|nr:hypothetical protein DFH07DRAFT_949913 [Mycena maculata]